MPFSDVHRLKFWPLGNVYAFGFYFVSGLPAIFDGIPAALNVVENRLPAMPFFPFGNFPFPFGRAEHLTRNPVITESKREKAFTTMNDWIWNILKRRPAFRAYRFSFAPLFSGVKRLYRQDQFALNAFLESQTGVAVVA